MEQGRIWSAPSIVLVPRAQFDDPAAEDRQRDELDRERQRDSDGGAAQRAAQEEQDDDKKRVDQQNGRAAEDRQHRNQRGEEEQYAGDTTDGARLGASGAYNVVTGMSSIVYSRCAGQT